MTMERHEKLAESLAEVINQSQAIVEGNWEEVSLDEYRSGVRRLVTELTDPAAFGSRIDLDETRKALREVSVILENVDAWHSIVNELKPILERLLVSVHANDI